MGFKEDVSTRLAMSATVENQRQVLWNNLLTDAKSMAGGLPARAGDKLRELTSRSKHQFGIFAQFVAGQAADRARDAKRALRRNSAMRSSSWRWLPTYWPMGRDA
ncbi:hypothetical protein [Cupriavidus consociatus]|uniref:hypothetical protein n=1 Tax=Cupriavidus consociatus TaxID=2821357 RepID=UPI001AE7B22F|nr:MULTISPECIES: hypothetical protein [unclassified Cupriavidus]MBP0620814.1 hypothetical protein [Cupriavidus sp. LEh25]MDK2657474.1 hypothetical protein [Cupriavidus sp. LEh21]